MISHSQLPVYQFTKDGYEALETEQAQLMIKRLNAVEDLRKAREMGDLSENGYYKAARATLSAIDSRLRRLKHLLQYGKIIEQKTYNQVGFGCLVVIADGNQARTFQIVGDLESNPMEGKSLANHQSVKLLWVKKSGIRFRFLCQLEALSTQLFQSNNIVHIFYTSLTVLIESEMILI